MNDHHQKTTQQEIDLTDIFSLIERFLKGILHFFFKVLDFIIKKWWAILLLVIIGVALGYLKKGGPSYKANLLVKTNFKSQSYVYTAIDQFNGNLEEKDASFISSLNKDPETFSIAKVSINPIVEAIDLIAYIGENDRTLSAMAREFKLKGDKELFATDRFLSYYNFHKLELVLHNDNQLEDIETLLDFINKNPYAQELKEGGVINHKEFIASQEESVKQINKLIESNSLENGFTKGTSDEGFYFNNRSYDLANLFDVKTELSKNIEEYKNGNVSYKDVAVIVSDIQAYKESSLIDNTMIIYPIVLVLLFLLIVGIVKAFINYKREIVINNQTN